MPLDRQEGNTCANERRTPEDTGAFSMFMGLPFALTCAEAQPGTCLAVLGPKIGSLAAIREFTEAIGQEAHRGHQATCLLGVAHNLVLALSLRQLAHLNTMWNSYRGGDEPGK